jgi:hypothetical protein
MNANRVKLVARVLRKYGEEHRSWIFNLFKREPLLFLDEAQARFLARFPGKDISISYLSVIMKEEGLARLVCERRAIQISMAEVIRFANEMAQIPFTDEMLMFGDEVSCDNRDFLRRRGYGVKGEKGTAGTAAVFPIAGCAATGRILVTTTSRTTLGAVNLHS